MKLLGILKLARKWPRIHDRIDALIVFVRRNMSDEVQIHVEYELLAIKDEIKSCL